MIQKTMNIGFKFLVLLLAIMQFNAVASEGKTKTAGVIATYAYKDLDREGAIVPLKGFVEKTLKDNPLGANASVKVLSSPSELSEPGDVNGKSSWVYQIIAPNLAGYLTAINRNNGFVPLAVPGSSESGESDYKSVIVSSKASNIRTLKELAMSKETVKFGMVWKDSTSGGIVPTSQLVKSGIASPTEEFASFEYLGSHQAALNALLKSDIQAAGFALGVLKEKLKARPDAEQQINLLWTSEAIPYGGLLCRSKIPSICEKIKTALLKNDPDALLVLEGLKSGWPEFKTANRFVEIDNAKMNQLAAGMNSQ